MTADLETRLSDPLYIRARQARERPPDATGPGGFARVADAMVDSPYRRWTPRFLKDLPA